MATAQLGTLLWHIRKLAAARCSLQQTDHELLDDFSARRDQTAFAALVSRHGPMVLRVCRRVLNHEQDAEDAFQATFLVLARNSGSIRKRAALAEWLHGVAYRTAMNAKRSAARRRNHEGRLRSLTPEAAPSPTWDDVQAVLDQEIQRLPNAFRAAFVLCVLEGKSKSEAAAELGLQPGTVSSRVTRARQRLQRQLARRGVELSALLAAVSVAEGIGNGAVPAVLASSTLRWGLLVAAGESAAGGIPSHVAALAAGATRAMFLTKTKIATAILLTASVLTGGAGIMAYKALAGKPTASQATAPHPSGNNQPPAAKEETAKPDAVPIKQAGETITYSGRVLAPDGKPVAGAKLYMTLSWGYPHHPSPSPEYATTAADGRFEFKVPKAEFADQFTVVAAAAANYGVGWVNIPADGKREDLTLQLVTDDVPISGQIVDLQGKPIPGATLTVMQINAAPGEDLGPWLEAAKAKKGLRLRLEHDYLTRYTIAVPLQVTTDAEGRFRLTGIGPGRLVAAQLDGPTVVSQHLHMLTRSGEAITVTDWQGKPEDGHPRRDVVYYGATFRHAAAPTKPIVGVVRDKNTKKALAGVTVRSLALTTGPHSRESFDLVRTTTDDQGRYRLTGMPKREDNYIVAIPHSDLPYVVTNKKVPDSPGLDPVTADIELDRGVWIEGKITDKMTGKPVRGIVEYFSVYSNPNLKDYPGFDGTILMGELSVRAKEDGSYRIVGLPGPGLVGVVHGVRHIFDHYLSAPERDDECGIKEASVSTAPYHISFTSNYSALARINPAKGVDCVKQDMTLDPGWTFTGTVLGPDGKPLAGVRCFSLLLQPRGGEGKTKTAEFTVRGYNPHRPILCQHYEKGLVGVAEPPKENGGSVKVRMEPGGTVTGRLIDEESGQPRAGADLEVRFRQNENSHWTQYYPNHINTDREGRFRVEALLPNCEFRLSDGKGELYLGGGFRSGQTKDLSDVHMKPREE
jgi:RNA polymerase sigma factor (sigma-70 family)